MITDTKPELGRDGGGDFWTLAGTERKAWIEQTLKYDTYRSGKGWQMQDRGDRWRYDCICDTQGRWRTTREAADAEAARHLADHVRRGN